MNKMMAAHGCIEGAQKISSLFRRSSPQGRRGGLLSAALLAISAVTFSLHRGPHLVLPDNSKTGSYFFMPPKGGRVALGGNKSFGSRVDGVVWNGEWWGRAVTRNPPAKHTRTISFFPAGFFAAFAPIFASLRETPSSRFGRGRSLFRRTTLCR